MGIIEEIRFFFFDVEDPARNQKLCGEMMLKIEKHGGRIAKKKRLKAFMEKFKALYMLSCFQRPI